MLDVCPSSHSSEDFLPQTEVFWNLKLSHVSFLPVLILLFQFPALWASCHFHCTGLSLGFLSLPLHWVFFTVRLHCGSICLVGLLLCLASASQGRRVVVSAKLNLRNGTMYVRGVCNFFSSVSLQQKFEAMERPVLQFSFIWQSKENTSSG